MMCGCRLQLIYLRAGNTEMLQQGSQKVFKVSVRSWLAGSLLIGGEGEESKASGPGNCTVLKSAHVMPSLTVFKGV